MGSIQRSSPDYRGQNSANHCFTKNMGSEAWCRSSVQRRSCIVCSGSSNQHPGDSLPWVTSVSDTLSAAYMPPTLPHFTPLCALSLFPSGLLVFLRVASLLVLLPFWFSCPLSLFLPVSTLPLPPCISLFWLACFKTLLLPHPSLTTSLLILALTSYSSSSD